jgi:hypothetical protein
MILPTSDKYFTTHKTICIADLFYKDYKKETLTYFKKTTKKRLLDFLAYRLIAYRLIAYRLIAYRLIAYRLFAYRLFA